LNYLLFFSLFILVLFIFYFFSGDIKSSRLNSYNLEFIYLN
jgi:hypothetical protein